MAEIIENPNNFELSKALLAALKTAASSGDEAYVLDNLASINSNDISLVLEELDPDTCQFIINLLPTDLAAEVIVALEEDTRIEFLARFSAPKVAEFIVEMDSDDGADVLNELSNKRQEQVLSEIDDQEALENVVDLLRYDEDSAGGLMAKEYIKANINWDILQTINEIRRQGEDVEKIYSIFVVDDQNILRGIVSLRKIILSPDQVKIKDIYTDEVIAVESYMEDTEVASIMAKYDLESVPVVSVNGKLLGRITIDDVIDVITEQAEQERQFMAGITEDVDEDDSLWMLTRARLPWLIIGLIGGLLNALFMKSYEANLSLEITFYIPLIMATGGNVGIQSSSIVVQALANKNPLQGTVIKRLLRVLSLALLNGLILGVLVFGAIELFMTADVTVGLVVALALVFVVMLASFMGTVTPLILDKFDVNPAVASGPFITTANDFLGLTVYLITSSVLLT